LPQKITFPASPDECPIPKWTFHRTPICARRPPQPSNDSRDGPVEASYIYGKAASDTGP
jgi:hypothetical protein